MCLQQNDFFCHVSLLLGGTIVVNKLCFIVPLRLRHFYMWTLCKSVSNMCARMHKSAQMISRKQTTQLVTWYGKWVVSCCAADRLPHHLTSRHLLQLTRFIYLCIYSIRSGCSKHKITLLSFCHEHVPRLSITLHVNKASWPGLTSVYFGCSENLWKQFVPGIVELDTNESIKYVIYVWLI